MALVKSRHEFVVLDGMRGIAALVVVVYHCTNASLHYAANGYAAVDFFFVLSGFVIAYSYSSRLANIGFSNFIVRRIIRLYPLYGLGLLLGGLVSYFFQNQNPNLFYFLLSLLFLPSPTHDIYPYNNPAWSLFFEIFVNFIFGIFRIGTVTLRVLLFISGIFTLLAIAAYNAQPGSTFETFWGGFPRVVFSFYLGVILHARWKSGGNINISIDGLILSAILICLLCIHIKLVHGLSYLSFVFLFSPLLVSLGAVSYINSPLCISLFKWLGAISYGVYILHAPIRILVETLMGGQSLASLIIVLCTVLVAAHLATKHIDIEVRKYLTNYLGAKRL